MKKCSYCTHEKPDEMFLKEVVRKSGTEIKIVKLCLDCRERKKREYEDSKSRRICPFCETPIKSEGHVLCDECMEKHRIRGQIKRGEARNEGMCPKCFTHPSAEGYVFCEDCLNKRRKRLPLEQKLINSARGRAKKKNIEFSITIADVNIPTHCPILGYELKMNDGRHKYNSYSLDRIDNSKGYVPGNIHVISFRANTMKGDASLEELEKLVQYLKILQTG